MKILILGGTGNISISIVRLLLEKGHEVTCFNRGESPKTFDTPLLKGDRKDLLQFEGIIRKAGFDAVIDMICFTAEQARLGLQVFRDIGHFVHCSTVCTYGIDYDHFPSDETHPLRPISEYGRDKVAADMVYLEAHRKHNFPVTIIKPSSTYGPKMGILRQVAWDFSWVDRNRKGKPILICDEGKACHQFLHVDDAAPAFVGVLENPKCIGEVYNMTRREAVTWSDYHRTAMRALEREVELVNISLEDLRKTGDVRFEICDQIFAHSHHFDSEKLFRDVPAFRPKISLEDGMRHVIDAMDRQNRIPNSDLESWEDDLIRSLPRAQK